MTLGALSIFFVVAVLMHNTEEALFLPAWSVHAARWYRPVDPLAFGFAAAALSLLLVVVALLAFRRGPNSVAAYLFFGYVFAMVANALVPHLVATLALRKYMPGTATGLLLNVPVGLYLLHEALSQGWVDGRIFLWAAPAVAVGLVVSIPVFLALGRVSMAALHRLGRDRNAA